MGTWQWAAYTHDEILKEHKVPLLINIDESPMPLVYANATGNIVRLGNQRNTYREPRRGATRNEQRIHFTYVAMICNIPWIQEHLPQILIIPERALPITEWITIAAELPMNVYLLRQPSMWVSSKLHKKILRLLRKCLRRLRIQHRYRVIVFADAFGGHITKESMWAMKDYGFFFVLLPAGLTWLLQPLDVQTFVQVKRFLRARYCSLPLEGPPDRIVLQALRDVLAAIAKYFVRKDWGYAFDSLGLNGACPPTSKYIHTELDWPSFPAIPRGRPTAEIIKRNTPGNRNLNAAAIDGCLPPLWFGPLLPAPPAVPPPPPGEPLPGPGPAAAPPPRRRLPRTFRTVSESSSSDGGATDES